MSGPDAPHGVIVPMISPVTEAMDIDQAGVASMVEHLVGGGVHGVFVLGTNGESASMDSAGKSQLVRAAVRAARGRVPVYAGISSNCLRESIDAASAYAEMGVSAVVAHPPFYFPIDNAGLIRWFTTIADRSPVPLLLYNIPLTTGISMDLEVIREAAGHANVIGIKDSDRDPDRMDALLTTDFGREFPVLSGSNVNFVRGLLAGAAGIVPSSGNLQPRLHVDLYEAAIRNDSKEVQRLAEDVLAVCRTYQSGRTLSESIARLKALAAERGLCGPTVLPPLRVTREGTSS